jgi:hypothetical protein
MRMAVTVKPVKWAMSLLATKAVREAGFETTHAAVPSSRSPTMDPWRVSTIPMAMEVAATRKKVCTASLISASEVMPEVSIMITVVTPLRMISQISIWIHQSFVVHH